MGPPPPKAEASAGPRGHLCVLQLGDAADVLRTVQAARGLKEARGGLLLTVVARRSAAEPFAGLLGRAFHRTFLAGPGDFPGEEPEEMAAGAARLAREVGEPPVDALANLSGHASAGFLAALVPAARRLGPLKDRRGRDVVPDRWSQYARSLPSPGAGPFSRVDVLRSIIGFRLPAPGARPSAARGPAPKDGPVVVCPFADSPDARWGARRWIEALHGLAGDPGGRRVVLVGAREDAGEAAELLSSPLLGDVSRKIWNLVGKKRTPEALELLGGASLFVGHGGTAGHLAALAGTPSLIIGLAGDGAPGASPHNPASIVLSPEGDRSHPLPHHREVGHQPVLAAARAMLSKGPGAGYADILRGSSDLYLTGTRVHRGRLSGTGRLLMERLSPGPPTPGEITALFSRVAWQYVLDGDEERHQVPRTDPGTRKALDRTLRGLSHAADLCGFAAGHVRGVLEELARDEPDPSVIKGLSAKMEEIDGLLGLVARTSPDLAPLMEHAAAARACLPGDGLVELAEGAFLSYRDLGDLCAVVRELARRTIAAGADRERGAAP